ncbi:kinase-like domain-containing protein [Spinellus fusiger]|nr:kinase-like domain-containing protein [Spinellus fusiger]
MGSFSTIEKQQQGSQCIAVKVYHRHHGQLTKRHYERELWAFRRLDLITKEEDSRHHLICLLGLEITDETIRLSLPYYPHTLETVQLNSEQARQAIRDTTLGLAYLHSQGMVHCDVSPSNVLVDKTGKCVLSDFGCSHLLLKPDAVETDAIGTRYYKAPEHLFGYSLYAPATDIWSLGAVYCQLLFGFPFFSGENDLEQISSLVKGLGCPTKEEQQAMACYPDVNKFLFFMPSEEVSDAECGTECGCANNCVHNETDSIDWPKRYKSLKEVLQEKAVNSKDCSLILGMLSWSRSSRMTTEQILKSIC